jgi:phosphorylase kinase alpha/beta subunit
MLDLVDERLVDMHKELVVRLRRIVIAHEGGAAAHSVSPEPGVQLRRKLRAASCDNGLRAVLAEEVLIHLGAEMKADPAMFSGCRLIRIWDWINLLEDELQIACSGAALADCAPRQIAKAVRACLAGSPSVRAVLAQGEAHHASAHGEEDWRRWRARVGVLTRVGEDFFDRVWRLLGRCDGLLVGQAHVHGARIESRIALSDHTPHERAFALLLEEALSGIADARYRTLTLEAINAAATLCEVDREFALSGDLSLDKAIDDSLRHADGVGDEGLWAFLARSPWDVRARLSQSILRVYRI